MKKKKRIILASQSPRRRELLAQAGLEFDIITSDVEEKIEGNTPDSIARSLSALKAVDVYNKVMDAEGDTDASDLIIIGADTIVAVDEEILGKPKDRADAARMLRLMSGRVHQVYTGVTIIVGESGHWQWDTEKQEPGDWQQEVGSYGKMYNKLSFSVCTEVKLYEISDQEIDEYLDQEAGCKGQLGWEDKAGAYGIQGTVGAKFIKEIKGDYNNVVGLPVASLYQELKSII